MEIWRGRVLWRGYVHPHTQLKKLGILHTHTQSMRRFPSKRERVRTIPTRTDLFAISMWNGLEKLTRCEMSQIGTNRPHYHPMNSRDYFAFLTKKFVIIFESKN